MNKICTSIEQSKKLIELGIDVNTADMRYHPLNPDIPWVWVGKPLIEKDAIPAWSLSALMEFMNRNCYNISLNSNGTEWVVNFDDCETFHYVSCDYPIDAAFKMVIWIKENNKI